MKNQHKSIVFLIVLLCRMADAQLLSPDQLQISAGYSIPQAPDQFYDYWSNGYGVSITTVYDTRSTISSALTLGSIGSLWMRNGTSNGQGSPRICRQWMAVRHRLSPSAD